MRPFDPRLREFLAPAARPLIGVLVGSLAVGLLVVTQAFAVAGLITAAVTGAAIGPWAIGAFVVIGGRAAIGPLIELGSARAAGIVSAGMRHRILLATLTPGETTSSDGALATLATRGVAAAEPYLTKYVPALLLAVVLPPLTVAVMATQDVISAVIVLATLPLIPGFGALVGLATRDRAETQWRALASLSGHFVDVMRGLPTLVAFGRARAQSATIASITDRYRRASMSTLRLAFASSAVLELVATLSVALVAVTVGLRLAAGELDLRTALVGLLLAPEAYWPLRRVGAEFHAAAEGVATFEQLSRLPTGAPAVLEAESDTGSSPATLAPIRSGPLTVSGVSVLYAGRSQPALSELSFTVPERGLTAIVGASGCGKSTLLAVLAGLLPPTAGEVLVGNEPAAGLAWRSAVSWVPQRPMFVPGTVADNLLLADPDASPEELWAALRHVGLEDRIRRLGGLGAPVAEDGRSLSAGERARLALARVLVAGRPWVLLDEPTAHVDPITENVIADVLRALAETSSVIVVAHRQALVDLADRVIELPETGARNVGRSHPAAAATYPPHPESEDLARPALLGFSTALGTLASLCGVALTATSGWLIVKAAEQPPVLTMLVAIVSVRAFGLGRPVFRYAERLRSHDVALRLLAQRRVQVYDAVVPLTPGRLGKRRGDVLSSIVDDVESVVDQQLRVRLPVQTWLVVSLVVTVVATAWLPLAGLIIAVSTLVAGAAAYLIARLGSRAPERRAVTARSELSDVMLQAAQLAPELLMWQAESHAFGAVSALGDRLAAASRQGAVRTAVARGLLLLAAGAGLVTIASLGGSAPPVLALLALTPLALFDVANPVVEAGAMTERTHAAQQRLRALETAAPAVQEPATAQPMPADRTIEGRRLTLGWDDTVVLNGLDLRLEPGTHLGVIGPSGAGKSTLASTLVRFTDPLSGEIRLGGLGLRQAALDDVRRTVGFVDDDPHVFASTLVENIRLARPGASDAEVDDALRLAHLGDWLDALPDGLQTWLGDGHAGVSGGERARLGLARSLLLDQPILVLDEPTAHLDRATATAVANDVIDAAHGRTLIWITHSEIGRERMDRTLDLGDLDSLDPRDDLLAGNARSTTSG